MNGEIRGFLDLRPNSGGMENERDTSDDGCDPNRIFLMKGRPGPGL